MTTVISVQLQPAVEHGRCDQEAFTQCTDSPQLQAVFGYDPEDEKETVTIVRNYGIRKDGVGMTAGTLHPGYTDLSLIGSIAYKVYDIAVIVRVDTAVTFPFACRTYFSFGPKILRTSFKNRF